MRRIVSSVASVVVIGTITAGCSSSALPVKPAKPVTMDGWTASVLWQQDAPVPAGADGGSAALGAVACSGATDCLAVGTAFANGDRSLPVADKFDGKSWIDTAPPKPDSSAQIDDVSCVRAWCVDVGESWHDLRGSTPFAYQYANGRWTAMTLPPLPGTFSGARFGKVACTAERSCLALFSLSDPADNAADFVLTLHNGTWAQVPESVVPIPKHSNSNTYTDVRCAASMLCALVGGELITSVDGNVTRKSLASGEVLNADCGDTTCTLLLGSAFGAVDHAIEVGSNGPAAPLSLPTGNDLLAEMQCASPSDCTALSSPEYGKGAGDVVARFSVGRWSATVAAPPGKFSELTTPLLCVNSDECIVGGSYAHDYHADVVHPFLLARTGDRWVRLNLPGDKGGTIGALGCRSGRTCVVIGNAGDTLNPAPGA